MNNSVELIGYYGSDEIICCSAWTSTSRKLSNEKRVRIPQMIKSLWENGHHTPFEKGVVHFLVNSDIASHIHKIKHRISSINAESARYKELKEDKYYIPIDWNVVYPGQSHEEYFLLDKWSTKLTELSVQTNQLYHQCLAELEPVLGRKRAKESARYFKMYNSQIESDVMFNMRSFANFLKLRRDKKNAQLEIYNIADQMLTLVKNIDGNPFEHTIRAWKLNEN